MNPIYKRAYKVILAVFLACLAAFGVIGAVMWATTARADSHDSVDQCRMLGGVPVRAAVGGTLAGSVCISRSAVLVR